MADAENDGQPSTAADGDGKDEDGVRFGAIRVGQSGVSVTVNVQNVRLSARLDAWIDFNGDGSWKGRGEQIFDSIFVFRGDNALVFDVPSSAAIGNTYARFRLSTSGNLGVGGAAADGEVEDYRVTLLPGVVDF
ncbi:MAG: LruC domain-containing protein, partial [Bacteroidetes bacterium]|nr:LruC domain-containing protein [Bacteroidota bacterium]